MPKEPVEERVERKEEEPGQGGAMDVGERGDQLQPDAGEQDEPLPQRQGGRRAAARQAELLMRQLHQPLSPPKQGGRRMNWRK